MLILLKKVLDSLKKIPLFIYKVLFALIATLIIVSINFNLLETYLFDVNTQASSQLQLFKLKKPKVAIIQITPDTLRSYQGFPSVAHHKNLLIKLSSLQNSQIVYNFRRANNDFANINGSYQKKVEFADLSSSMDNLFFIFNDMDINEDSPTLKTQLNPPYNNLKLYSAPRTIDSKINSKGAVTRRIILDYKNQILVPLHLASKYNRELNSPLDVWGNFERIGTHQVYIRFHPNNSFPTYSFEEVLSPTFDSSKLDNMLVLVGDNTDSSIDDYTDTPFASDAPDLISTTELYANMFQTLIDNNAPKKAHTFLNFLLTFIISTITVYVALSVKPSKGILLLVGTFFAFWIFSLLLLSYFNLWIGLSHPFLAIFLCYYFFIPYRLIIENRRSWEYLQKNKLLQQVEELKTNFISMMSHDLKTPIARIQGMTEVILKDNIALSNTQREAVDTIKSSSDDLLRFINAILQYGRIESQGIELNKQSKDINKLLQEVIKKHEFLAKVKRIRIEQELEPMFPIPVDSELIKQVFSNLVENAIKYSPEESCVRVRSKESDGKVVVEIHDEGVGIPLEDLPNIFMKFYRSHNVKTSTIKGSGLGLYLAKYFVELHQGTISATSEPEKGSTFTVELPLGT